MLLLSSMAFAATLEVANDPAVGLYGSVQEAIDAASDGDTVLVGSGTFVGSVVVDRPVLVKGAGMNDTVLIAGVHGGTNAVDLRTSGASLEDLTVSGEGVRRAVRAYYDVGAVLTRVKLRDGLATDGGGLLVMNDASATLRESVVCGNVADPDLGGGVYVLYGFLDAEQTLFLGNQSAYDGGAIHIDGYASLFNNTFLNNNALSGSAVATSGSVGWVNNLVVGEVNTSGQPDWSAAVQEHGGTYLRGPNFYFDNFGGHTDVPLPGDIYDEDPGLISPDCETATLADVALAVTSPASGTADPVEGLFDDFGAVEVDRDGDGHGEPEDCNDDDPAIHAEAPELCDAIDNNCDEQVDEGLIVQWWRDADDDGYGTGDAVESCTELEGYALASGDCDDLDANLSPGLAEVACDGLDNDCDPASADDVDCDTGTETTPVTDPTTPTTTTPEGDDNAELSGACGCDQQQQGPWLRWLARRSSR